MDKDGSVMAHVRRLGRLGRVVGAARKVDAMAAATGFPPDESLTTRERQAWVESLREVRAALAALDEDSGDDPA